MKFVFIAALAALLAVPVALHSQVSREADYRWVGSTNDFRDLTFFEKTTLAAAYLTQRSSSNYKSLAFIYNLDRLTALRKPQQLESLRLLIAAGKIYPTHPGSVSSGRVYSIDRQMERTLLSLASSNEGNPFMALKQEKRHPYVPWVVIGTINPIGGIRPDDVVLNLMHSNEPDQPMTAVSYR